jgi:leucyl-tRNA synthetase
MPWCETCDGHVEDDEVTEDGECTTCGEPVTQHRKIPWQFKIMIYITIIYLGYRAFQGVTWVVHHV